MPKIDKNGPPQPRKEAFETLVALVPHLMIEARAGCGKTTVLVEGLKRMRGIPSSLTPSPQQERIWKAMEQSGKESKVCFVAFNKGIAEELKRRVPAGCDASTMHGMGYKAILRSFPGTRVNQYRVSDIICEILKKEIRVLRKKDPILLTATEKLVNLCKMNLITPPVLKKGSVSGLFVYQKTLSKILGDRLEDEEDSSEKGSPEDETREHARALLSGLAFHYEVDLGSVSEMVFDLVPSVLQRCREVRRDGCVDFSDMIWLPVVLDLPLFRYDVLLWDEVQDGNRCQQELAKRAGDRLILVGDSKQALYGFAGADSESMSRLAEDLEETERGCVILPLTVTRRCGKAIVAEAQKIVADFEAFPTNGEGRVSRALYPTERGPDGQTRERDYENTYLPLVQSGDLVLCRCNAPLVSQVFRFLKMGRKANILGRDIGKGLLSTLDKMKAETLPPLIANLSDWHYQEILKEQAKRNPNEARLIALTDRHDCLLCFIKGALTVAEVRERIERVFTDNREEKGIRLSSIHKAKGLEASRVFFLVPPEAPCPHPLAKSPWQVQQEWNARYVAITRAIDELVFVS
jgi:DNA helicase-2/ATP-dependent DNA helicase PcrA